jgi:WD40 repeat protein
MCRKLTLAIVVVLGLHALFVNGAFVHVAVALENPLCQAMPEVRDMAFSPDGKYLVAVGGSNSAQLWDVESGKKLLELPYKDKLDLVYHIVYAKNGKYIAASTVQDAALWDAKTGKLLYTFKGNAPDVTLDGMRVAFTLDSKYLLVSDYEASILWDVQTGRKVRTFPHGASWQTHHFEQFSPDGKYLLTNGVDIVLWEVETGKIAKKFGYHKFSIVPEATFLDVSELRRWAR